MSSKLKVIIANRSVYPFHPYAGVEKYAYFLSQALVKEGVDVEIIATPPESGKRQEIYQNVIYTFIPPVIDWSAPYTLSPSWRQLIFSLNVARYLRKKNFDILHGYDIAIYAYLHLKNRRPVVYQPFERIYDVYDFKAGLRKLNYRAWSPRGIINHAARHLDRYCLTHADAVASEGDSREIGILTQLLDDSTGKAFKLPTGVNVPSIVEALGKNESPSRKDLGLASDDMVLITVNNLEVPKGINYLIDAFSLVKQKVPCAKLILIGAGSEEDNIREQIKQNYVTDRVIHLKNIPDDMLYQYYALSDIYVSPSVEMSSITGIIEGMACGLSIVSTGQDYWVKSGVNGYVVPKRNPEAMAQAIVSIYEDGKCREFGDVSRKIALDYDYGTIVKMAVEKYQELLEKRAMGKGDE